MYEALNPGEASSDEERALMMADPWEALRRRFEAAHAHWPTAPCAYGFKLFASHATHATFLRSLWDRLDTAIVLRRSNSTQQQQQHA